MNNLLTYPNAALDEAFVRRALFTAKYLHDHHTSPRSEDGMPYFSHPFAIVTLLSSAGYSDPVTLATAACHDLFDKTPTAFDDLVRFLDNKGRHGIEKATKVAQGALGLSDETTFTEAEWEYARSLSSDERRVWKNNRQIEKFFALPESAKPGRFGDIIHNAATMSNGSNELRMETHRKGMAMFDEKNWDGNVPQAILANVFFMNINGDNDDLIGPYGVRAPIPFIDAIPEMVSRAVTRFEQSGYPQFCVAPPVAAEHEPVYAVIVRRPVCSGGTPYMAATPFNAPEA